MNGLPQHLVHTGDPPVPLGPHEVRVWYALVADHTEPWQQEQFRALLATDERRRLERLVTPALKQEFLLTRALCRHALSWHTGVAPAAWTFECNRYGRPEIRSPLGLPALRFNLSNTRSMVACAVALDTDVGVDVECWNHPGDTVPMGAQVFSDTERLALQCCPPALQRRRFYQHWTLKEAYIKARGVGLSLPLHAVSVDPLARPLQVTLAAELGDPVAGWQFEQFELESQHVLALAVCRDQHGPYRVVLDKACLSASPARPSFDRLPVRPRPQPPELGMHR